MPGPQLLAWGALVMLALVLAAWVLMLRTGNAAWVDVAWAIGMGALALLFAVLGPGWRPRRELVGLLGGLWGLRLGLHLALRTAADRREDARYARLRQAWGGNIALKFLGFFLFQGLLDLALAWPFLAACLDTREPMAGVAWAGAGVWSAALAGEALADAQLARFRADPGSRGKVCAAGLWRLSRHPNYFFQWLAWVGCFLVALPAPLGWTTAASPLLILFFLLRVTGIPATEEQALASRGDAYRRYQQATSAFIPWFPRRRPHA
jgi:steroid 5-alpha reductase family enzyme